MHAAQSQEQRSTFVQYDGEEEALAHVLEFADYQPTDDAERESWLLLEEV